MNLDGIDVFVKVVQLNSFSAAARVLGMPVTTVSGKIAHLEKRLGVTLIQRTTRKLNMTTAGQAFFKRCLRALEEMEAGEQEIATAKKEPEGLLRITAPNDMGYTLLPPLIRDFLKEYPKVRIELIVTNRVVDLVGESVDLAIRTGTLKNSALMTRKFIENSAGLWATPGYLKRMGTPKHPRDLKNHDFIVYASLAQGLKLVRGNEKLDVPIQPRIIADDFAAIKAFVINGDGIGLIPNFICESDLKSGKLVTVLPQWSWGEFPFYFVYPPQQFLPPKVQAFLDWVKKIQKGE